MPQRRLTYAERQWIEIRKNSLKKKTQKIAHKLYQNRLQLNQQGGKINDWLIAEHIANNPIKYVLFKANQTLMKVRTHYWKVFKKDFYTSLYAAEGLIVFFSFIFTIMNFPIRGPSNQNNDFTEFWAIPGMFIAVALLLDRISEDKVQIPSWIFLICSRVAGGVWLAFSLETMFILNDWYADPESNAWEPLFTATGLSSAGLFSAQSWIDRIWKKNREN